MAEQINHKGVSGLFIPDQEWTGFVNDIEQQNLRVQKLEDEIELVRSEAKYKLKKLAKIIARKDKQLDELKGYLKEK